MFVPHAGVDWHTIIARRVALAVTLLKEHDWLLHLGRQPRQDPSRAESRDLLEARARIRQERPMRARVGHVIMV